MHRLTFVYMKSFVVDFIKRLNYDKYLYEILFLCTGKLNRGNKVCTVTRLFLSKTKRSIKRLHLLLLGELAVFVSFDVYIEYKRLEHSVIIYMKYFGT